MFFESHHSIDEQEFHVGSGNNMFFYHICICHLNFLWSQRGKRK